MFNLPSLFVFYFTHEVYLLSALKHGFRMVEKRNCVQRRGGWSGAVFLLVVSVVSPGSLLQTFHHFKEGILKSTTAGDSSDSRCLSRYRGLVSSGQGLFLLCWRHTWFIVTVPLSDIPHTLDLCWELNVMKYQLFDRCNH